jgi:hypothetical protein
MYQIKDIGLLSGSYIIAPKCQLLFARAHYRVTRRAFTQFESIA